MAQWHIMMLCLMSFDHWISWLTAISGFFVHRLYVRLLSCENLVFQGLDTLTPTLIVSNGVKVVSHVLVMFSVLCTVYLGCGLWVVAVLFLLAAKTVSFFHFHEYKIYFSKLQTWDHAFFTYHQSAFIATLQDQMNYLFEFNCWWLSSTYS